MSETGKKKNVAHLKEDPQHALRESAVFCKQSMCDLEVNWVRGIGPWGIAHFWESALESDIFEVENHQECWQGQVDP